MRQVVAVIYWEGFKMTEADELKYKIKLILAKLELLFVTSGRSKQFRSDTHAYRKVKEIEKMLKELVEE
jgi:hypothetical protein